ncbi:MAG: hypothetical protein M1828_006206 [Chrysothrix sp. TS-e1954]|nr:MAG: hypothetical protein M1828_006206 [Chrysothrix sp. TS-e1954]
MASSYNERCPRCKEFNKHKNDGKYCKSCNKAISWKKQPLNLWPTQREDEETSDPRPGDILREDDPASEKPQQSEKPKDSQERDKDSSSSKPKGSQPKNSQHSDDPTSSSKPEGSKK